MQSARPPHSAERFVTANGITLCYDTFGIAGAPALVLIMGLAAQLVLWDDDFCALLAAQGRYVIRFDNRDIGRSTHLNHLPTPNLPLGFLKTFLRLKTAAPYTLVDMANDTIALIDALGFETVDVMGASMGGAIAQELAIHHPKRLRTVTLVMASTGDPKLRLPTVPAFRAIMEQPPHEKDAYLAYYARFWTALSGAGLPIDPVRTTRQGELQYERGINAAGARRQFGAILASGDRTAALTAVKVPVLVIHGACDPLLPPSHGRALAAAIPAAKLEIVPMMGHALPAPCWPQIANVLAAHAPVSSGPEIGLT